MVFYIEALSYILNSRKNCRYACEIRTVQIYFYNKGVEFGMNEKYDKYKVGYTITDFHNNVTWSTKFHTNVQTTTFQQGYDAINNLLKEFKYNREK